jgi:hypothetical protein
MPETMRSKAALCRRLARVPTAGGHGTDGILIRMAAQLEQDAERAEAEPLRAAARRPGPGRRGGHRAAQAETAENSK